MINFNITNENKKIELNYKKSILNNLIIFNNLKKNKKFFLKQTVVRKKLNVRKNYLINHFHINKFLYLYYMQTTIKFFYKNIKKKKVNNKILQFFLLLKFFKNNIFRLFLKNYKLIIFNKIFLQNLIGFFLNNTKNYFIKKNVFLSNNSIFLNKLIPKFNSIKLKMYQNFVTNLFFKFNYRKKNIRIFLKNYKNNLEKAKIKRKFNKKKFYVKKILLNSFFKKNYFSYKKNKYILLNYYNINKKYYNKNIEKDKLFIFKKKKKIFNIKLLEKKKYFYLYYKFIHLQKKKNFFQNKNNKNNYILNNFYMFGTRFLYKSKFKFFMKNKRFKFISKKKYFKKFSKAFYFKKGKNLLFFKFYKAKFKLLGRKQKNIFNNLKLCYFLKSLIFKRNKWQKRNKLNIFIKKKKICKKISTRIKIKQKFKYKYKKKRIKSFIKLSLKLNNLNTNFDQISLFNFFKPLLYKNYSNFLRKFYYFRIVGNLNKKFLISPSKFFFKKNNNFKNFINIYSKKNNKFKFKNLYLWDLKKIFQNKVKKKNKYKNLLFNLFEFKFNYYSKLIGKKFKSVKPYTYLYFKNKNLYLKNNIKSYKLKKSKISKKKINFYVFKSLLLKLNYFLNFKKSIIYKSTVYINFFHFFNKLNFIKNKIIYFLNNENCVNSLNQKKNHKTYYFGLEFISEKKREKKDEKIMNEIKWLKKNSIFHQDYFFFHDFDYIYDKCLYKKNLLYNLNEDLFENDEVLFLYNKNNDYIFDSSFEKNIFENNISSFLTSKFFDKKKL